MIEGIRNWIRRTLRGLGLRALTASGLPPSSRAVLVILDAGDGTRSRLTHLNVRTAETVEQGGLPFLSVEDVYGRRSLYRMDSVVACRHMMSLPDAAGTPFHNGIVLGMAEGA